MTSFSFVGTAMAQAAAAAPKGPSIMESMLLPVGMLLIMYFLVMRPQQKRAKDQNNMLNNLKNGDEVVTTGGIIGKVRSVADGFVTLEIAPNTSVKILKANIVTLTKAPEKAAVPVKA